MSKEKLNVLCVCQIGVGSSIMLRVFVDKVLNDLGVTEKTIEISDASTAGGLALAADVIIANCELENVLQKYGKPVISLANMTSKKEIAEKMAQFLETFND